MSIVLVIDDRPDARYSMARPLAAAGFDVRETATFGPGARDAERVRAGGLVELERTGRRLPRAFAGVLARTRPTSPSLGRIEPNGV
jgi:hypothetical protein